MDTPHVESDAGLSSGSVHDEDEHPVVLEPSASTEALNTTSKDDANDSEFLRDPFKAVSDKMNIPPFSLKPYLEQAPERGAKNDETAGIPSLGLPGPQPPPLPARLQTSPAEFYSGPVKQCIEDNKILSVTDTALPLSSLRTVLKELGKSDEIGLNELAHMLHSSGYLDAGADLDYLLLSFFDSDFKLLEVFQELIDSRKKPAGTSDLGRLKEVFKILKAGNSADLDYLLLGFFDSDFKLLEVLQEWIDSSKKPAGTSDLGRLKELFKFLEASKADREYGLKSSDSVNASNALDTNLTNADGDSLEQYSKLNRADPQDSG